MHTSLRMHEVYVVIKISHVMSVSTLSFWRHDLYVGVRPRRSSVLKHFASLQNTLQQISAAPAQSYNGEFSFVCRRALCTGEEPLRCLPLRSR